MNEPVGLESSRCVHLSVPYNCVILVLMPYFYLIAIRYLRVSRNPPIFNIPNFKRSPPPSLTRRIPLILCSQHSTNNILS